MSVKRIFSVLLLLVAGTVGAQVTDQIRKSIQENYSEYESLYEALHQHPELSFHEVETSRKIAEELRKSGISNMYLT